jgi:hypothetical protein
MAAEAVDRETGEVLAEEHEFGGLDFERLRRFVVNRQGTDFLLFAGLISGLHQLSAGYFAIETRIEQLPSDANGQVAVCSARVQVFDPDQPDVVRRLATGIGDASPQNVNRMMANAVLRMAETRAKARALRDLLGVAEVTVEELGPQGAEDSQPGAPERAPQSAQAPVGAPDRIKVGDQVFARPQVWAAYRKRVAEARAAGLALPDDQGDLREDAPLSAMVGASQAIRRRLEARDGTGK